MACYQWCKEHNREELVEDYAKERVAKRSLAVAVARRADSSQKWRTYMREYRAKLRAERLSGQSCADCMSVIRLRITGIGILCQKCHLGRIHETVRSRKSAS